MSGFMNVSEKLIEVVIGIFVYLAVSVALMPTLHTEFTYYINNLTGIGLSSASALATVTETVLWILATVIILLLAFKYLKGGKK